MGACKVAHLASVILPRLDHLCFHISIEFSVKMHRLSTTSVRRVDHVQSTETPPTCTQFQITSVHIGMITKHYATLTSKAACPDLDWYNWTRFYRAERGIQLIINHKKRRFTPAPRLQLEEARYMYLDGASSAGLTAHVRHVQATMIHALQQSQHLIPEC